MRPPLSRTILAAILFFLVVASPAAAQQRFIVRTITLPLLSGTQIINTVCRLLGCTVKLPIDPAGQVFLVTKPTADPLAFLRLLLSTTGIQDAEVDQVVQTVGTTASNAPPALLDSEPISYYGATVRRGYVEQPATQILGLAAAQQKYGLTGKDTIVAVIDTGVDPNQPVLAPSLVAGYDFTHETTSASEFADLDQSTVASLDQSTVASLDTTGFVNQSTVASLDQSTVGALDTQKYAAFGHGTMVAGVVHLTAPRAKIMPLKAFNVNGAGFESDVLRAIYFAADHKAKVVNMSFDFDEASHELERAINYAQAKKVITVAAAGNDGQHLTVYPAGLPQVIGVASTTNFDTLSSFSNFGSDVAWIAAPGEGVVTTYPLKAWAAAWGTSFSSPFAAGTAALLAELGSKVSAKQAEDAEGSAVWIAADVNRGRLDISKAIEAAKAILGIR